MEYQEQGGEDYQSQQGGGGEDYHSQQGGGGDDSQSQQGGGLDAQSQGSPAEPSSPSTP